MTLAFERAVPEDAEAIVRVQIAAFHDDARIYPGVEIGGPPGYDSISATRNKIYVDIFYKIVLDGEIVGVIVLFDRGAGHMHLDLIAIHPDHHNKGIGTQAIAFVERAHPASRWTLDTPVYATRNHHFYEKLGYVRVREFADDGFRLYAYQKRIGPRDE